MTTASVPTRVIPADDTLYCTDNGAVYCGRHLGTSAAYTGRDLSGQPIMRIGATYRALALEAGFTPRCERCSPFTVETV